MTEFNVQALADSIAELGAQDGPTPSIRVAGASKAQIRSVNAELSRRGIAVRARRDA